MSDSFAPPYVELIVGEETVISYHDDGSKKQGVEGYSVQGITINKKYRALPTLPIAAERRENLATLKVAILDSTLPKWYRRQ